MSPQQCLGTTAVDARSDIYSLGCVIYEALSGLSPFLAATPLQTILKHLNDHPVPRHAEKMRRIRIEIT